MQETAISVIIPMFNSSAYIKECVDSVLAQTFQDFEILIVDDASTDGSLALCRELYGNLSRVKLLPREKNGTVGAARNTGMKAAKGKYIAFLDSDDLYMPNALENFYRTAEEYGADVVHSPGCYLPNGDVEHISVEDEVRMLRQDKLPLGEAPEILPMDPGVRTEMWAEKGICTVVWNNLFRRDFLRKRKIWFEEDIVPGQDGIFMFRCVFYADPFVRISNIPCIYRRPASSVTRTRRDGKFLGKLIHCMARKGESLEGYMENIPYFKEHPQKWKQVRGFAITDTDPFFAQDCYLPDGTVPGDMGPVHEAFRALFGKYAWFGEHFFHAAHRKSSGNVAEWGLRMNYVFPWHLFAEGSRLALYGAGEVGKSFYEQVLRFPYLRLVGIVDRNAGKVGMKGIPVEKPEKLLSWEFDDLLITVVNGKIADEIRRDLIGMGIPSHKIRWDGKNYPIEDFYRNFYFPRMAARQAILYGAGLNAQEYFRYMERHGKAEEVLCFAVTKKNANHPEALCGKPLYEIEEALRRFPKANIFVTLQEKYHEEVRGILRELGREAKGYRGLRFMTELLGEEGIREISHRLPGWEVMRKPMDYSMIYLHPKEKSWQIYEFYPMTQVPLSEADLQHLEQAVDHGFSALFGNYPHEQKYERTFLAECTGMDLFLAMASSAKDMAVEQPQSLPSYLHRVQAGAAFLEGNREERGFYDDRGENISEKNVYYSELTVTYWLWKNVLDADFLGICHYRRHFCLNDDVLGRLRTGSLDVILPRPRLTFPDVKGFLTSSASSMEEEDYRRMLEAIEKRNAKDGKVARAVAEGRIHFPNNMLIARRRIFGEYCQWIFDILTEIEEGYRREGIKRPPRYLGYIGELLTTIFVAKNRGRWNVEYVDYALLE